jgi:hypothetical protein
LVLRPGLALADAVAMRLPSGRYRARVLPGLVEPLTPAGLVAALPLVLRRRRLRPRYDETGLTWLLGHLQRVPDLGALRARLVRTDDGKPIGWFVYFASTTGTSGVVQLAAAEDHEATVLGHLFEEARHAGSIAVRGRLDPPLLTAFTAAGATLGRDGPWVLIQSRRAEVLEAFQSGDAFVSGLDGERWMTF